MSKLSRYVCTKLSGNRFINFDVFYNKIQSKFSIVFAHNILGNYNDMQFMIDRLVDEYNVVAPNFPGHDGSHKLEEYHYDSYLNDCMTALNLANSRHVIWIGQGVGGILGAKLASYATSPIVGLVVFDCDEFSKTSISSNDVEYEYNNFVAAKEALYSKYADIEQNIIDHFVLHKYKVINEMFVNNYHINLIQQMDNFLNCNLEEILNNVRCRALVIGKQDLIKKLNHLDVYKEENAIRFIHKDEHISLIYNWIKNVTADSSVFFKQFKKYI